MTPAPRRKAAVNDPAPVRLAVPTGATPHEAKPGRDLPCTCKQVGEQVSGQSRTKAKPARSLPAGMEPLLGIDDLAALLSCSRRLVERMRSAGKVPKPDIHVGRCPRWRAETVRAWIERGAR